MRASEAYYVWVGWEVTTDREHTTVAIAIKLLPLFLTRQ